MRAPCALALLAATTCFGPLTCDLFTDDGCTECPDGNCYDLDSDEDHCGSCTNSCAAGQVCYNGSCSSSGGSCPFVFLWEDGEYRYATDLSGSPLWPRASPSSSPSSTGSTSTRSGTGGRRPVCTACARAS